MRALPSIRSCSIRSCPTRVVSGKRPSRPARWSFVGRVAVRSLVSIAPEAQSADPAACQSRRASDTALAVCVAMLCTFMLTTPTRAGIDPVSGIDFVRIGAVGNPAWQGNGRQPDLSIGRGGVGYEYNIGRLEVTSAQWAEFYTAALIRPADDLIPFVGLPSISGITIVRNSDGSERFVARPGHENDPAGGISWRTAAIYCNWLTNNKGKDRSAFLNGAYDTSTFFTIGVTDQSQATHNPGATYWIPTLDEWLKAAHYDPNKSNTDGSRGGWWVYSNGTDRPLISGRPPSQGGTGEANYGFATSNGSEFQIPLGAYTNVTSPWGLFDVAGATTEWTEERSEITTGQRFRALLGSAWSRGPNSISIADSIYGYSDDFSSAAFREYGFRIASSIPSPSTSMIVLGCCGWRLVLRKRGRV